MTTTNTRTIKSSGGDYTSLSSWEAGRQADLVAGDLIEVAECYDLGAADTTAVNINGWTTGASNYIRITVPSAERHTGTRNTSKYRLVVSSAFSSALEINEEYVRVEGLQLRNSAGNAVACMIVQPTGTSDIRISDTIAYDVSSSSIGDGFRIQRGAVQMFNCAAFSCTGTSGVGIHLYNTGSPTLTANNCVAANCTNGFAVRGFLAIIVKNCYAGGSSGSDYTKDAGATITKTTCYSEDGSESTSTAAFSTSSGAYFTNVTGGSENLHIGASSALKDAGTSLAGWSHPGGDVDVDGDARSGTWDVGYDEYVSAGATTVPYLTLLGVGS